MLNVLLPYEPLNHLPSTSSDPAAYIMASFQLLYVCTTPANKSQTSISTVTAQINMEIGVLHFGMRDRALNDAVPSLFCLCLFSLLSGRRSSSFRPGGRFGPDTGLMNERDDL